MSYFMSTLGHDYLVMCMLGRDTAPIAGKWYDGYAPSRTTTPAAGITHARQRTHTRTHISARTHARMLTHARACAQTHTHVHTHTRTRTRTQTPARTQASTHTHTGPSWSRARPAHCCSWTALSGTAIPHRHHHRWTVRAPCSAYSRPWHPIIFSLTPIISSLTACCIVGISRGCRACCVAAVLCCAVPSSRGRRPACIATRLPCPLHLKVRLSAVPALPATGSPSRNRHARPGKPSHIWSGLPVSGHRHALPGPSHIWHGLPASSRLLHHP